MPYLILLVVSILLLGGFVGLTILEARRGKRFLESPRKALDRLVQRALFLITYVHWSAFLKHVVQSLVARIAHDIAHVSLMSVRFLERELTAVVRYLRDRRPNLLAPKPSRDSALRQTTRYLYKTLRLPESWRK
jgi:hypothetical protein